MSGSKRSGRQTALPRAKRRILENNAVLRALCESGAREAIVESEGEANGVQVLYSYNLFNVVLVGSTLQ